MTNGPRPERGGATTLCICTHVLRQREKRNILPYQDNEDTIYVGELVKSIACDAPQQFFWAKVETLGRGGGGDAQVGGYPLETLLLLLVQYDGGRIREEEDVVDDDDDDPRSPSLSA